MVRLLFGVGESSVVRRTFVGDALKFDSDNAAAESAKLRLWLTEELWPREENDPSVASVVVEVAPEMGPVEVNSELKEP